MSKRKSLPLERSTRILRSTSRKTSKSPKTPKTKKSTKSPKIIKSAKSPKAPKFTITTVTKKTTKKSTLSNEAALVLAAKRLHLSSVPESLPCRDSQFNEIYNYIHSNLKDGNGGCMYISGVPGTGKTATVYKVMQKLEAEVKSDIKPFVFVEVNGLRLSEPHQCYVQILRGITGEKRTTYQALDALNDRFSDCDPTKKFVILLVDELDLLRTRKQDILYHLFDWPSRTHSRLIVLAVANAMDLPEKLMINRVSSRLGLTRISFNPYAHKELEKIIKSRLSGLESRFNSDALQLICRKVAAVSGDARRTLDICRRAVEIAQTSETDAESVTMAHVEQAIKETFSSMKLTRISEAATHEQIFLRSIAQEFRVSGLEEANFGDVCLQVIETCKYEAHYEPNALELARIANTLSACGLILLEKSDSDLNRRIRLNVSVDDIAFAINMH